MKTNTKQIDIISNHFSNKLTDFFYFLQKQKAELLFKNKRNLLRYLSLLFLYLSTFFISSSHAEVLNPLYLKDIKGESSSQSLKVVAIQDQSNFDDNWDNYIEFITGRKGYNGILTFPAPADLNNLDKMVLHVNYRGAEKKYQKWVFKIFDFQAKKWTYIVDNSQAASWEWKTITRSVGDKPRRFINNKNKIKLRFHTRSSFDNSQLDYVAIKTTSTGKPNIGSEDTPALENDVITEDISLTPGEAIAKDDSPAPKQAEAIIENVSPAPKNATNWWKPKPGSSWEIIYTGNRSNLVDVDIYNIDLFDINKSEIDAWHAQGKRVICYFSGGSIEDWNSDAKDFPASIVGNNLDNWPGEKWLDIRNLDALLPIMEKRMDLAVAKGCDAVDPDNMDGYTQNSGFPLNANHQVAYNIAIAEYAHSLGLAVGLKNDLEQVNELVEYFDFAVNEECFIYKECAYLKPFAKKGKPVFGIEYKLTTDQFCSEANKIGFNFLKKNLSLDAFREPCR